MRQYYISNYQEKKAKLPQPDGKHCIICGKDLPKFKKKYCSNACLWKWNANVKSSSWQEIREFVMERDKNACQDCGEKHNTDDIETRLEVHHSLPIQDGGEEFSSLNSITLCHGCHVMRHKRPRTKTHPLELWMDKRSKIKQIATAPTIERWGENGKFRLGKIISATKL